LSRPVDFNGTDFDLKKDSRGSRFPVFRCKGTALVSNTGITRLANPPETLSE
jgi:hypothetical protein